MSPQLSTRRNPWFRRFRDALLHHDQEIVLEGPKMVRDAIAAGWAPIAVAATADVNLDVPGRSKRFELSPELARSLADTDESQGVFALFQRPSAALDAILARRDSVIIALDEVQDPGNVGTIVRLAAAFDASGVLLLGACADPFGPKAIRASAGAVLAVPIAGMRRDELLDLARDRRLDLLAADMKGAAEPPPAAAAILLFGNEGAGVPAEFSAVARSIAIPTSGRVESLNVAAAAAILLAQSFHLRGETGTRP
jgi:RNA methyltransferase, TrmH family